MQKQDRGGVLLGMRPQIEKRTEESWPLLVLPCVLGSGPEEEASSRQGECSVQMK